MFVVIRHYDDWYYNGRGQTRKTPKKLLRKDADVIANFSYGRRFYDETLGNYISQRCNTMYYTIENMRCN